MVVLLGLFLFCSVQFCVSALSSAGLITRRRAEAFHFIEIAIAIEEERREREREEREKKRGGKRRIATSGVVDIRAKCVGDG